MSVRSRYLALDWRARSTAIVACVAFELAVTVIVGIGHALVPSPSGVGTHTQLGLPACVLLDRTGIPCPACGMTTAIAHLTHGHVLAAFGTQPFAALLGMALAVGAVAFPVAVARGASVATIWEHALSERLAKLSLALFVAAWLYKVLLVA